MRPLPLSLRVFAREWIRRCLDPAFWRTQWRVRRGQRVSVPWRLRRRGEVWAIAMVKNEADIIEAFVQHIFSQGIDRLLVLDNLSSDHTWSILTGLADKYPVTLGRDIEPGYYQAHKMSRLAALARKGGADWVIPMDADEFWFAEDESLADALRSGRAVVRQAAVHNAFPTPERPMLDGLDGVVRLDRQPGIHGKMCARTFPGLWIRMGNHQIERPGREVGGLHILHLPWRNREQFVRKAVQGAAALEQGQVSADKGSHWRRLAGLDEGEADAEWQMLLRGIPVPGLDWSPSGESCFAYPASWTVWRPS